MKKQNNNVILRFTRQTVRISAICLFLTSCGTSAPTKFYQLQSGTEQVKPIDSRKIIVGVDTADVAGYIERPQIVTLSDNSELYMSEYNRWAEPLSDSVQRVVAENLSKYLKNGMAKPVSTKSEAYDYIVTIELNKLDGELGKTAQLDAWWTIGRKNLKNPVRERTTLTSPVGKEYNDLVEVQSKLISELSKQIAVKISKMN